MKKLSSGIIRILKAADKVLVCQVSRDMYYVSDTRLIVPTKDKAALIDLDLIGVNGLPQKQEDRLQEVADESFVFGSEFNAVKDTGLVLDSGDVKVRMLRTDDYLTGLDVRYFGMFGGCKLSQCTYISPIYAHSANDVWLGCVYPVRLPDKWNKLLSVL